MKTKIALIVVILVGLAIFAQGCSSLQTPNLMDELQTSAQLKDVAVPTQLTDLGIVRYGEKILAAWGLRSEGSDVFNTGSQIALAGLSTGVLAASGGGASAGTTRGLAAGANFLLQLLGIIKPAERNDARHEGAAMILDARGAFLESLAAKKIYHISNTRYTPQGAIYFRNIGAALKVVDKLLVGLAPRVKDLEDAQPVPIDRQPDPTPEAVSEINRENRTTIP